MPKDAIAHATRPECANAAPFDSATATTTHASSFLAAAWCITVDVHCTSDLRASYCLGRYHGQWQHTPKPPLHGSRPNTGMRTPAPTRVRIPVYVLLAAAAACICRAGLGWAIPQFTGPGARPSWFFRDARDCLMRAWPWPGALAIGPASPAWAPFAQAIARAMSPPGAVVSPIGIPKAPDARAGPAHAYGGWGTNKPIAAPMHTCLSHHTYIDT